MALSVAAFAAGWYRIVVRGTGDPHFARVPTYGLGAALLIYTVVSVELPGAAFSRILQWFGGSPYISHHLLIRWTANLTGFQKPWKASSSGHSCQTASRTGRDTGAVAGPPPVLAYPGTFTHYSRIIAVGGF